MRVRTLLLAVAAFVFLDFAVGTALLRFGLEPLLLPHVAPPAHATTPLFLRLGGDDGNAMLVRRYGIPRMGCVVFFPGQHGITPAYEKDLFPAFAAQGISVLAVAYPGQNGAAGTPHLPEIQTLAARIVASAQATCPGHRVVVYGRSLGAMVAAYAAGRRYPAGIILESAAPSLSSAVRLRLHSRWFLKPLELLPVSRLLAHDYSLHEALSSTLDVPAVVFQGTADSQTPLAVLRSAGLSENLRLVVVSGGSHSSTYLLAREKLVQVALCMLGGNGSRAKGIDLTVVSSPAFNSAALLRTASLWLALPTRLSTPPVRAPQCPTRPD